MTLTPEMLNENEILLYLGWRGQTLPEDFPSRLDACRERLCAAARPRWVWRVFALDGTAIPGAGLALDGADIREHLADCSEAVLMAATVGPGVDTLLRREQVRDMTDAVITDACAGAAVEAVCDMLESELRTEFSGRGLYLTDRFSPGYGDLPLGMQRSLCAALDAERRIGLTVTPGGMLAPVKSVTAILGAAATERKRRAPGCAGCVSFRTCALRKEGKTCGR